MDQAAERLYLVDEQANEIPVQQVLLLLVSLLGRDGARGSVALPVTATSLAEHLLDGSGLTVRRTQASLAALTRASTVEGTVFAGAATGGFVFPGFLPAYDAVASLANVLELLAPVERPLSALVAELPLPTVVHRELRCPWALKGTVMRVITERLKDRRTDLLDGIKVFDDRGWAQVIPDASEPIVHLYAEGDTEADAGRLEAELRGIVEDIIAGEEHPTAREEPSSRG